MQACSMRWRASGYSAAVIASIEGELVSAEDGAAQVSVGAITYEVLVPAADVPALAATLTHAPDPAAIAQVADRERTGIEAHPLALACTVWSGWWLTYLARARQMAGQA